MVHQLVKQPIYQQLNAVLRRSIMAGEFAEGDKFFTERAICEKFVVSRATANKAVANLVSEGLLEFKKGVGTFVRPRKIHFDLRALVSFSKKAVDAGMQPSTAVLRFESLPAGTCDRAGSAALSVSDTERLYYIKRVRMADREPVILERRWMLRRELPDLSEQQLYGSLYKVLTNDYGITITGARQTISAASLRAEDEQVLKVREGTAALSVHCTGYAGNGHAVWFEKTLYRSDRYVFNNELGGIEDGSMPVRFDGSLTIN